MRNFIGLTVWLGLFVAPVVGYAQTDSSSSDAGYDGHTPDTWGIEDLKGDGGLCMTGYDAEPFSLMLEADLKAPNIFTFSLLDGENKLPKNITNITITYGNGVVQTLTGSIDESDNFNVDLSNGTQNNFAVFLHGFTASKVMFISAGTFKQAVTLSGTSDTISDMGKCTNIQKFNYLPKPWLAASSQPPVVLPPPAPLPPAFAQIEKEYSGFNGYASPDDSQPPTPAPAPPHWWAYSYWAKQCNPSDITPKEAYDAENDYGKGPTVDRIDPNHVRIEYPDPQSPNLVDYNDFFRTPESCQAFADTLANQNSDLN
jgi:sRNA-binding regulator protein Hfq